VVSHHHHLMCHQNPIYHHDTIQARSDSDFVVKLPSVHLYIIEHNSKSNRGIELKLYQKIPKVFFYVGVNVHVHQSLERTCDIGQKQVVRILLLTFYLTRILFLKGCGSLFWEFSSSTRIFNELKHNFQEAMIH